VAIAVASPAGWEGEDFAVGMAELIRAGEMEVEGDWLVPYFDGERGVPVPVVERESPTTRARSPRA
jgi:hypothetical protein